MIIALVEININVRRYIMKWSTPEYSDIRFGFEVTMYINNK
jgi:coenzyme PQQ precursor peptide PqqA